MAIQSINFLDLSDELQICILEKVPFKGLPVCMAVCKQWQDIILSQWERWALDPSRYSLKEKSIIDLVKKISKDRSQNERFGILVKKLCQDACVEVPRNPSLMELPDFVELLKKVTAEAQRLKRVPSRIDFSEEIPAFFSETMQGRLKRLKEGEKGLSFPRSMKLE